MDQKKIINWLILVIFVLVILLITCKIIIGIYIGVKVESMKKHNDVKTLMSDSVEMSKMISAMYWIETILLVILAILIPVQYYFIRTYVNSSVNVIYTE